MNGEHYRLEKRIRAPKGEKATAAAVISVRFEVDEVGALDRWSTETGATVDEIIRRAVKSYLPAAQAGRNDELKTARDASEGLRSRAQRFYDLLMDRTDALDCLLVVLKTLISESFETRDTRPLTQPLYAWASGMGYPPGEDEPLLYVALVAASNVLEEKAHAQPALAEERAALLRHLNGVDWADPLIVSARTRLAAEKRQASSE